MDNYKFKTGDRVKMTYIPVGALNNEYIVCDSRHYRYLVQCIHTGSRKAILSRHLELDKEYYREEKIKTLLDG